VVGGLVTVLIALIDVDGVDVAGAVVLGAIKEVVLLREGGAIVDTVVFPGDPVS
jgi:hypothetical protein